MRTRKTRAVSTSESRSRETEMLLFRFAIFFHMFMTSAMIACWLRLVIGVS